MKGDGEYIRALLKTIKTLSSGRTFLRQDGDQQRGQRPGECEALVYVAAFAPDAGETTGGLDTKFPGTLLGPDTLAQPVPLPGGGNDLYVRQDKFHEAFAPDLPEDAAKVAAATQRPITDIAFGEPATDPAWKTIPSWFIYGDSDTAIPPQALAFMADRAHPKETVVVKGASHVVMVSHPDAVAKVIEDAATTE